MFRRVVLKLSGEVLSGPAGPMDADEIIRYAKEIKEVISEGVQLGIVLGGGNIIRGRSASGDRVHADRMGMIATILNGMALKEKLDDMNIPCKLFSSLTGEPWLVRYERGLAIKSLEEGNVVIFAGGSGLPYFSTDTASALRAIEIKADALLKTTKVKGVYDKDPEKYPNAEFFSELTYQQVLEKRLGIMDLTAISLCMDNKLPVLVFSMYEKGNLKKAVSGEKIGTIIRG